MFVSILFIVVPDISNLFIPTGFIQRHHWVSKEMKKVKYFLTFVGFLLLFITKEKTSIFNRFHSENLVDLKSCPDYPIITFKECGRLGNQMSSYANVIALAWQFGYHVCLPFNIKRNLEEIFENVTFPVVEGDYLTSNEECNIYNKGGVVLIEDMDQFVKKIFDCHDDNQSFCLPSAFGQLINMKIMRRHNVRLYNQKLFIKWPF